jgi:hypothetical protein
MVEVEVLDGACARVSDQKERVLGSWSGLATSLLVPATLATQANDKNVIRVEGDVRLPLRARERGLGLAVSSRLVKLDAGAPSDLREVPGLGLRGLVGAVAGCVEVLVLSPCDAAAYAPSKLHTRPRFLVFETSIGRHAFSNSLHLAPLSVSMCCVADF